MGVVLVGLPLAGGGGREVFINPEQVVCVRAGGDSRTQIVTTGLSTESSITLMVDTPQPEVVAALVHGTRPAASRGKGAAKRAAEPQALGLDLGTRPGAHF